MEHLIHDPELVPGLFKLLDDKLQETRRVLEQTRKEKEELEAQLLSLQTVKTEDADRRSEVHEDVEVRERRNSRSMEAHPGSGSRKQNASSMTR